MTYKLWLHSLLAVDLYFYGSINKLSAYTVGFNYLISKRFKSIERYL